MTLNYVIVLPEEPIASDTEILHRKGNGTTGVFHLFASQKLVFTTNTVRPLTALARGASILFFQYMNGRSGSGPNQCRELSRHLRRLNQLKYARLLFYSTGGTGGRSWTDARRR